jgi:hypothetical protein
MLFLWLFPFKIQKQKLAGLQFTSTDYLSLFLTPLRIRWTIPLRKEIGEYDDKKCFLNFHGLLRNYVHISTVVWLSKYFFFWWGGSEEWDGTGFFQKLIKVEITKQMNYLSAYSPFPYFLLYSYIFFAWCPPGLPFSTLTVHITSTVQYTVNSDSLYTSQVQYSTRYTLTVFTHRQYSTVHGRLW